MKNKVKCTLLNALLFVFGCSAPLDPYSDYCNSQIVDKGRNFDGYWLRFRHDSSITKRVAIVEFDYNNLEIGDTVKCR